MNSRPGRRKVASVVGARPQFIKAGALGVALSERFDHIHVNSGQHYDFAMAASFFQELNIQEPDHQLEIGSGTHGEQTARCLERCEQVFLNERPDVVLVYGDTNTTLAAALAAQKLHIPVAHVEAGLRSFDMGMPEEVNRRLTDHLSTLLFCPTHQAVENLEKEGIATGVHWVGDVMLDLCLKGRWNESEPPDLLRSYELEPNKYILATVHRAENTDPEGALMNILDAFEGLSYPVVFPVHPRSKERLRSDGAWPPTAWPNVRFCDPFPYSTMMGMVAHARRVVTDSGGLQKEAYFLGTPCVTIRRQTEWTETVNSGWNRLVNPERAALRAAIEAPNPGGPPPPHYGDGKACVAICDILDEFFEEVAHE